MENQRLCLAPQLAKGPCGAVACVPESQTMPGQRHPNKKQLTLWRHEKDMDVLREVAKLNDISMSELMEILIEDFQKKKNADQVKYLRNKRRG